MAQATGNVFQAAPAFQLYSSTSPSTAAPTGPGPDPYYYNVPPTVNLSGKIGTASDNIPNADKHGTASSLIGSVTSAVETGYHSARQVVWGQDGAAEATTGSGSFSLFSLSYQQMVNFGICIAVGLFFMFLAFLFLPMVVFAPQKFTLLFTLGCLCWIAGLAMLQGTKSLLAAMLQKERLPISMGYVGSLLGTLYATLLAHSYILTMLCAVAQIVTLIAFIVSYFPGGIRMLTMMKDMVVDKAKGALGMRSGSILPI